MKKNWYFIMLLLPFVLGSCGSDMSDSSDKGLQSKSICQVGLSYDVATRIRLNPMSAYDREIMTDGERILATPFFQNVSTDLCISEARGVTGTVEVIVPEMYDQGAIGIGQWHAEPGKRTGNVMGSAITWDYPDGGSEIASSGYQDLGIQGMIDALAPQPALPDSIISALPEIYTLAGYDVEIVDDRFFKVIVPVDEGYTAELFDKEVQKGVSTSHYDSDGNLLSRSTTIYHELDGQQVPRNHVYKFPVTLPGSGAQVWYRIESAITNYTVVSQ